MANTVIQPKGWAKAKGYANGMLSSDGTLYVGGQIGWTVDQIFESQVVEAANGRIEDITRLTWFVLNKKEYAERQSEVGEVYRRVLGRHFPAMSMLVVAGLVEDDALLEIEATAYIGQTN